VRHNKARLAVEKSFGRDWANTFTTQLMFDVEPLSGEDGSALVADAPTAGTENAHPDTDENAHSDTDNGGSVDNQSSPTESVTVKKAYPSE
jgi:hypothetical protein